MLQHNGSRLLTGVVLSLTLCLAAGSTGCAASMPEGEAHPLLQQTPEPTEMPSLDGDQVTFPKKGSVTVIDFWATNCEPCKQMMPGLEAIYESKKDQGFELVGVAIDDNPGLVEKWVKKLGVTYPTLLDDSMSSLQGQFQVDKVPQTFVFDKNGKLRLVTKQGGEAEVPKIKAAVEALLSE
jgi:thiol-disulfide isomerase/thioredoxin